MIIAFDAIFKYLFIIGKNGTDGRDGLDGRPGEDAFFNEYTKRQFQGEFGRPGFRYNMRN